LEGKQRWTLARREPAAAPDHLGGVARDEGGEGDGAEPFEDVLVHLAWHGLPVGEGGSTGEKLEDEDAKRPDVGALVMRLVGDNLRRDIFRGATERPSSLLPNQLLGKTKVSQLDVAGRIKEQVLWFEIPVDDASGMEVIKGEDDTGDIEGCRLVGEPTTVPQQSPKFPAQARLHQHVQVFRAVERLVHLDDEWASALEHDLLLVEDMLLLLHVLDLVLL